MFIAGTLIMAVLLGTALAAPGPQNSPPDPETPLRDLLRHQPKPYLDPDLAKTEVDTIYLLGGEDRLDGQFEDSSGNPAWHGWQPRDFTALVNPWHASDTYVLNGDYSLVCGQTFIQGDGSTDFGYGNVWNVSTLATFTVEPGVSHAVHLAGLMNVNIEEDWDFLYLEINRGGFWEPYNTTDVTEWTGIHENVSLDHLASLRPGDLVGDLANEVQIRVRFVSDSAYSDQDGNYDSDGACWLDDVVVTIDGEVADTEDFEDGDPGVWSTEDLGGCGSFAALYENLLDADPCRANTSVQVAYVDDGMVVPGTGGTPCITWCYGPEGYIVNHTGGLMGEEYHVRTAVVSPTLEWVEGHDMAVFIHNIYVHETMSPSSSGVFYRWYTRSTTAEDPTALDDVEWVTTSSFWYGGPGYYSHRERLGEILEPGRRWFQVRLEAWEAGYLWNINGSDGTPAPYIDAVRIFSYPYSGPEITTSDVTLAQDSFPEQGDLDFTNLANNHVRFDRAWNISQGGEIDPGDSLTVRVTPVRAGSTLEGMPQMVVRMKANPVFDGVRTLPPGFVQDGPIITGSAPGRLTYNSQGQLVEHMYNFDLPDTGFFYPGDEIHYFFEARDNQDGDIGYTRVPQDTMHFSSFDYDLQYWDDFICRALPSVLSPSSGDQPTILFWNDFEDRGGQNEWMYALRACGLTYKVDYDVYYTHGPDSGVGNGLGALATSALLGGYDVLLYTSGDFYRYTLGWGDWDKDPSPDIQVLNSWFNLGGKKAFFTGDDLASDISASVLGQNLLTNYFGIQINDFDLRPNVDRQVAPLVRTTGGLNIFPSVDRWIAYGGCLEINTFDAVQPTGPGIRLAEFCDENGNAGAYPYAAAVYHYNDTTDSEVVYLPYDFHYIYNAPGYVPPPGLQGVGARGVMLIDLLNFFGLQTQAPVRVPDTPRAEKLAVNVQPNPFNPRTTLALSLPHAGHVRVKIFNVRGELVRVLQDGHLLAGQHELVWDGRDTGGGNVASGVYFAETRAADQSLVTRMALIR
jgi:hypothetical protein